MVENIEEVCRGWLVKIAEKVCIDSSAMPVGAYEAFARYRTYSPQIKKDKEPRIVTEARKEFEEITGITIEDFLKYKERFGR